MRILRERIHCELPGHRGAELVAGDERPFALCGAWAGGGALVGSEPVRVAQDHEDPFALLDDQPEVDATTEGAVPGVVACGWFGYLGYGLGATLEALHPEPPRAHPLPRFALAFHDHLLHMDSRGRWFFEALWTPERAEALDARLALLRERGAAAGDGPPPPFATEPWRPVPGPGGHGLAVRACRERIHAGDLIQANVTMRLESALEGDAAGLFATGAAALEPDRGAYLAGPWGAVASLSPELFLERHGRRVRSAPIKGTAAQGRHGGLGVSEKDRAENTMIVDLVRNDLGRACAVGSVSVPALAQLRPHTGVWHLVSEVTGRLPVAQGDAELVRSAFPPGSVTGAPKIAAQDAIAELESTAREVYTGAIGFASPLAGLELSVAIRTFETDGEALWLGVGGGVVADSDPASESGECLTKAMPLLEAVGAELAGPEAFDPLPLPPAPRRAGPRPAPRPRPEAGVFETLLVRELTAVDTDLHLRRLEASVRELYGLGLPDDLPSRMARVARRVGDVARMRVDAVPRDGELHVSVKTVPIRDPRPRLELVTVSVPGGLGPHKWADRALIEALEAEIGPAAPLWCDLDGQVLEAARANVFCVDDHGVVHTPPLDGRVLPGVTRAQVLARAREAGIAVRQEPLGIDHLRAAAELFVTGSIGGVEAVLGLDGDPAPGLSDVGHLLGGRVERRAESQAAAGAAASRVAERMRSGRR